MNSAPPFNFSRPLLIVFLSSLFMLYATASRATDTGRRFDASKWGVKAPKLKMGDIITAGASDYIGNDQLGLQGLIKFDTTANSFGWSGQLKDKTRLVGLGGIHKVGEGVLSVSGITPLLYTLSLRKGV